MYTDTIILLLFHHALLSVPEIICKYRLSHPVHNFKSGNIPQLSIVNISLSRLCPIHGFRLHPDEHTVGPRCRQIVRAEILVPERVLLVLLSDVMTF